jgi:hypothetical protein
MASGPLDGGYQRRTEVVVQHRHIFRHVGDAVKGLVELFCPEELIPSTASCIGAPAPTYSAIRRKKVPSMAVPTARRR